MVSRSQISDARRKELSRLKGLLEIVSLKIVIKSAGAGTNSNSRRDRVPDFRSCNGKAAGAK